MIFTPVGTTCLSCVREKVDEENRQFSRKATLQARLAENYDILKRRSILNDDTLLTANFQNFKVDCPEQKLNLERAKIIAKRVSQGEQVNAWFIGQAGRGKSHLAMSIVRELNELGKRRISAAQDAGESLEGKATASLFIDFDGMLRMIRKSFNDKETEFTEDYFIKWCCSVDYLVIDDLGAETGATDGSKQATDFVHRVLYAIANGRRGKTTIITTNLNKAARETMYDPKILSRLYTNTAALKFEESPDMRESLFEW